MFDRVVVRPEAGDDRSRRGGVGLPAQTAGRAHQTPGMQPVESGHGTRFKRSEFTVGGILSRKQGARTLTESPIRASKPPLQVVGQVVPPFPEQVHQGQVPQVARSRAAVAVAPGEPTADGVGGAIAKRKGAIGEGLPFRPYFHLRTPRYPKDWRGVRHSSEAKT